MRKVIYSNILKTIAVVLFIASIVLGVLTATNGVMKYCEEEEDIYSLEGDFSESWYVSYLLNEPENVMFNAYHSTFRECEKYDQYGHLLAPDEETITELQETLENNIKQWFNDFHDSDKLNYFVQWNDVVLTNCGAETAEDLFDDEYYSYLRKDDSGVVERGASAQKDGYGHYLLEEVARYDDESTFVISCSIKENVAAEYKALWEKQEGIVTDAFYQCIACATVALLMFIYLVCVCGKNADGERTNMWLDNI